MSSRCLQQRKDPLELLEKILHRTTLTTQRIGHNNIEDVGEKVLLNVTERARLEREEAVKQAIKDTQERADKRLQEELDAAEKRAEEDKARALEEARIAAAEIAAQVKKARDQLEDERIAKITWTFRNEKKDALQKQWEECEKIKKETVEQALEENTRILKNEFALEKQLAIARALKVARINFKRRLEEAIRRTREECERIAAEEAARVAKLHKAEVERLTSIIEDLRRQVRDETDAREWVQMDFRDMQRDYKRFLDYTDGKYHSDYMMRLRKHGMKYDHNWDRRDSEEVDMYLLPSFINYHTRTDQITSHDPTENMNFAPLKR